MLVCSSPEAAFKGLSRLQTERVPSISCLIPFFITTNSSSKFTPCQKARSQLTCDLNIPQRVWRLKLKRVSSITAFYETPAFCGGILPLTEISGAILPVGAENNSPNSQNSHPFMSSPVFKVCPPASLRSSMGHPQAVHLHVK